MYKFGERKQLELLHQCNVYKYVDVISIDKKLFLIELGKYLGPRQTEKWLEVVLIEHVKGIEGQNLTII